LRGFQVFRKARYVRTFLCLLTVVCTISGAVRSNLGWYLTPYHEPVFRAPSLISHTQIAVANSMRVAARSSNRANEETLPTKLDSINCEINFRKVSARAVEAPRKISRAILTIEAAYLGCSPRTVHDYVTSLAAMFVASCFRPDSLSIIMSSGFTTR